MIRQTAHKLRHAGIINIIYTFAELQYSLNSYLSIHILSLTSNSAILALRFLCLTLHINRTMFGHLGVSSSGQTAFRSILLRLTFNPCSFVISIARSMTSLSRYDALICRLNIVANVLICSDAQYPNPEDTLVFYIS